MTVVCTAQAATASNVWSTRNDMAGRVRERKERAERIELEHVIVCG